MNAQEEINYYNKVNKKFSEAVYQKMVSIRYGIDFCCQTDLERYLIDKTLLDLNNKMDKNLTPTITSDPLTT